MDAVNESLCAERRKVQDERFDRDKERIEKLEQTCDELKTLSIQMGELLKKYDDELEQHSGILESQTNRLDAIEQRPAKWWEKLTGAILTAIGSAIGGCVLTLVVQNIAQR